MISRIKRSAMKTSYHKLAKFIWNQHCIKISSIYLNMTWKYWKKWAPRITHFYWEFMRKMKITITNGMNSITATNITCECTTAEHEQWTVLIEFTYRCIRCSQRGIAVEGKKGGKLIVSVGIIDTMTKYNIWRVFEETIKSIYKDPTITNPEKYAKRLNKFLSDILKPKSAPKHWLYVVNFINYPVCYDSIKHTYALERHIYHFSDDFVPAFKLCVWLPRLRVIIYIYQVPVEQ